jgi:hypothetical protein
MPLRDLLDSLLASRGAGWHLEGETIVVVQTQPSTLPPP